MARISVVTDSNACVNLFLPLARSRNYCMESRPIAELKDVLTDRSADHFVYLDVTGLSAASQRARLRQLQSALGKRFGVVDRNGAVKDPAEVFHRGASDYVNTKHVKNPFTAARVGRVIEYALSRPPTPEPQVRHEEMQVGLGRIIPSGADWEVVEAGREYTFQMLYVGLDHVKEMRRKSSEEMLRGVRRSLQGILTRTFAPVHGRIWVWKEDNGVLLCPFDGERLTALVPAMRLALNRVLMNIEQFGGTTPISWRMGLHVGNTKYEASGATSSIVSQSLNFIFHFGERALKPGQLAVTGPSLSLASEKIRQCFVRESVFESMPLYVLRRD